VNRDHWRVEYCWTNQNVFIVSSKLLFHCAQK